MSTTRLAREEGDGPSTESGLRRFSSHLDTLISNISGTVVASEQTVRFVLLGLVAQGHILLEDVPGVGKTLLAKAMALSIDGMFGRIQCTPDLLPSDITGTSIFNMQQSDFEFKPGPIFSNVLLADEINRTGPRTQAALLEAMAEFQLSIEGEVFPLPRPFLVIATQNIAESHGVFPLPDSQMDRFLIRMSVGLPTVEQELEILTRAERGLAQVSPVLSTQDVLDMQNFVNQVEVSMPVKEYLVNLARTLREHPLVSVGVSPRGTVLLQRAAQGWAAFEGRGYLIPEDVKKVAPLVLAHRISLSPGSNMSAPDLVAETLDSVAVPV